MANVLFSAMLKLVILISSIINMIEGSVSCNFDLDRCSWQLASSSKFEWRMGTGQTADRSSGPLNDHTCGNYRGGYMFIPGEYAMNRSDAAVLESNPVSVDEESTLTFWYIMNGFGTGSLSLSVVTGNTTSVVWQKAGRQSRTWTKQSVTLAPETSKLHFKADVRLPFGSDIAIDDVQLSSEHPMEDMSETHCRSATNSTTNITTIPTTTERTKETHKVPSSVTEIPSNPNTFSSCMKIQDRGKLLPGTCDFEKDACGIKVTANDTRKSATWERDNNLTDFNSGPKRNIAGDHTFEHSHTPGFYMHFLNGEGQSSQNPKETASLETPAIHAYITCLSFWYSVPSKYSNLKVLVRDYTGKLRLIWSVDNEKPSTRLRKGTGWYTEAIEITEEPPFTVVFQTVNSWPMAVVGLDDIKLLGMNLTAGKTSSVSGHATTTAPHSKQSSTTTLLSKQSSTTTPLSKQASTTAPFSKQASTTPPHSKQASTTAPFFKQASTTAPHSKQASTTAPLSKQTSTTTPSSKQASTTAPFSQQASTTAPLSKQAFTTAPLSKHASTTAPLSKQASTTAQYSKQASTTASLSKQASTTAPLSKHASTTAPLPKQASTTAPLSKQASTIAPHPKQASTTAPLPKQASTNAPLPKQASTTAPHSNQASTTTPLSKQATTTEHIRSTSTIGTSTSSSLSSNIMSETTPTASTTSWSSTSTSIEQSHATQMKISTQNSMKSTSTKMSLVSVTSSDPGSTATSLTNTSTSSITATTNSSTPKSNMIPEFGTSKSPNSVGVTTISATTNAALATQSRISSKAKGGKKTTSYSSNKSKNTELKNRKKDKQTEVVNYRKTSTIVGCTVGAVFALVLIVVVIYFIAQNKIKAKQKRLQGAVGPEKQDGAPQTALSNGTYLSSTVNEQITPNGHHRHGYDNFTAYSLNEMNLLSKDEITRVHIANRESLPDNTKHVSIANAEACYNGQVATVGQEEYLTRL